MTDNTTELDFGTTAQKATDAEKLPVVLLALDQGRYDMARSLDELRALADANRLHIVSMLSQREMCAIELLQQLEISQPTLSHHMKALTLASLVKTRKVGAQVYYTLNSARLDELLSLFGELRGGAAVT